MRTKPKGTKRPKKWLTDKETGVRTLPEIYKLPVDQLSDEEICKLFFKRFEARALLMLYVDADGIKHLFGRLWSGKAIYETYKTLLREMNFYGFYLGKHNVKQMKIDIQDE